MRMNAHTEADIEKYYRAAVIDCDSDRSNIHHGVIQYTFSMTAAVNAHFYSFLLLLIARTGFLVAVCDRASD
jgi:hypothetical protein